MTRHDLSVHIDRKKARMTTALKEELGHNPAGLAPGQWRTTRAGHVVKLTHVGPIWVDGILWKEWPERWICSGLHTWKPSGSYFDAIEDGRDLMGQIDEPEWSKELVA